VILAVGFCPRYHLHAIFMGVFHAVSSFNNAGFDLTGSSLVPFAQDPLLILTHAALIITGGLGYAVLLEIGARVRSPNHPWTLHARFVLMITAILLVVGTLGTLAIEWGNPHTLGQLAWPSKILDAFFQSVTARTAGFTSLDTGLMHPASQFLTIMLMFIGASPGSTGGGIKTTTFAIRGGPRRVPRARDGGAHRERLASPNILDVIDLAEDVSMLEFTATAPLAGKTLNELSLRRRFGITVLAIKRGQTTNSLVGAESRIEEGDILVVAGSSGELTKFAAFVAKSAQADGQTAGRSGNGLRR